MFVVTGVSGHTGSVVANALLAAGQKVRVLVRSADKGQSWRDRGAEVAVGSVEDEAALAAAFQGATGAYLLVPPPGPEVQGILARMHRIIAAFAAALTKVPVPHVAFLSSVGAQHPAGTGPIAGLYHAEQTLSKIPGVHVTFVRAAYFMENLGGLLGAIHHAGVLPAMSNPVTAFPMVATQDIGETAAHALLNPPAKTQVLELSGPKDYSFSDAATAFSQALGKQIHIAPVPPEGIVPALTQAGLSAEMAELYREMSTGIDSGHVAFAGEGATRVRGHVALETVVQRLLGA